MKKTKSISKKNIHKAVTVSSKIEGISFAKAKKNTFAIHKLRKHGRAFSL